MVLVLELVLFSILGAKILIRQLSRVCPSLEWNLWDRHVAGSPAIDSSIAVAAFSPSLLVCSSVTQHAVQKFIILLIITLTSTSFHQVLLGICC